MTLRILLFFCCFPVFTYAQSQLAIGQWRDFLPYRQALYVTQSNEKIYFATDWSVFSIDKADRAVDFLSKTNGLSQTGIQLIKYNRFSNILLVVYDDSVIDLVKEKEVVVLTQIRNFQNIIGSKVVNDIFVQNDSIVYLSTSYGVSKLNIRSNKFMFTTFTGISVENVVVHDGFIYAATEEGIYRAAESNFLLDDFNQWTLLEGVEGFPLTYSAQAMAIYKDELYLGLNDSVFHYRPKEATLTPIYGKDGFSIQFLTAEGQHLLAGFLCDRECNGMVIAYSPEKGAQQLPNDCTPRPLYAIEDSQQEGSVWLADIFRFVRHLPSLGQSSCELLSFNSPYSHNIYEIELTDKEVWVAAGGVDPRFGYLNRKDGIFLYRDNQWTEYNSFTTPELIQKQVWDFVDIAIHPATGKVYAASVYDGLVEFDGDKITVYDDNNSSLGNGASDPLRTRVSGLDFDAENNLWISNYFADRPISVLTNEGVWKSFLLPGNVNQTALEDVVVDQNGYKWFIVGSTAAGILVMDTGESIEDTRDDRYRLFSTANGLPTNKVNAIEVDLDGEVWVGTSEGVVYFACGDVFDSNCQPTAPITNQDANNLGYLLEREDVRTIAIDGANRKWFGTTNGIFIQSPDGREQVGRFEVSNSPLIDNTITDIAIHPKSGEVFIGTAKGLVSYRGEATAGGRINSASAYAFPNPVRPEYTGPIAIKGLAENANVKITDVNGQLIYETEALGGQAIWDGNDYNGRRASSGVYLVFSTSNDLNKPDAIVTKILILN